MQDDRKFPGPVMVIASYRPKAGKEAEFRRLIGGHVDRLRKLGLATERPQYIMQAADGAVVEVFEWASQAAIERAHQHPEVLKMWGEFDELCDFVALRELNETNGPFPNFLPLN